MTVTTDQRVYLSGSSPTLIDSRLDTIDRMLLAAGPCRANGDRGEVTSQSHANRRRFCGRWAVFGSVRRISVAGDSEAAV